MREQEPGRPGVSGRPGVFGGYSQPKARVEALARGVAKGSCRRRQCVFGPETHPNLSESPRVPTRAYRSRQTGSWLSASKHVDVGTAGHKVVGCLPARRERDACGSTAAAVSPQAGGPQRLGRHRQRTVRRAGELERGIHRRGRWGGGRRYAWDGRGGARAARGYPPPHLASDRVCRRHALSRRPCRREPASSRKRARACGRSGKCAAGSAPRTCACWARRSRRSSRRWPTGWSRPRASTTTRSTSRSDPSTSGYAICRGTRAPTPWWSCRVPGSCLRETFSGARCFRRSSMRRRAPGSRR